jgi:hypothetical protein
MRERDVKEKSMNIHNKLVWATLHIYIYIYELQIV